MFQLHFITQQARLFKIYLTATLTEAEANRSDYPPSPGSKSGTNSDGKSVSDKKTISSTGLMSLAISIHYCFDQETKSPSFKPTGIQSEKMQMMAGKKTCSFALQTVLDIFLLGRQFLSIPFNHTFCLIKQFKSADKKLQGKMRGFKYPILQRTIKKCFKFSVFTKHNGPCPLLRTA